MSMRSRRDLLTLFCIALVSASCETGVKSPVEPSSPTTTVEPVVRTILAQTENPPGAPGRRLTLVRYTIAPGAELPPHVHPGVQMASIVSGTLAYRVISGMATVHRQVDASGVPAAVEELAGPFDAELRAGDAVIEIASMVHFGANKTAAPVVILATLITDPAADLAVPAPPTAE